MRPWRDQIADPDQYDMEAACASGPGFNLDPTDGLGPVLEILSSLTVNARLCLDSIVVTAGAGAEARKFIVTRVVARGPAGVAVEIRRDVHPYDEAVQGTERPAPCPRCQREVIPDSGNCAIVGGRAYHLMCAPREADHG